MSRFLPSSKSNSEKYEVAKNTGKDVDYGSIANLINNEVGTTNQYILKPSHVYFMGTPIFKKCKSKKNECFILKGLILLKPNGTFFVRKCIVQ